MYINTCIVLTHTHTTHTLTPASQYTAPHRGRLYECIQLDICKCEIWERVRRTEAFLQWQNTVECHLPYNRIHKMRYRRTPSYIWHSLYIYANAGYVLSKFNAVCPIAADPSGLRQSCENASISLVCKATEWNANNVNVIQMKASSSFDAPKRTSV